MRKQYEYMLAESDLRLNAEQIGKLESKVVAWRNAYPSWDEGDVMEAINLAKLAARRYYLAATPLNRANAVTALLRGVLVGEQHIDELLPEPNKGKKVRLLRHELRTETIRQYNLVFETASRPA